MSVTVDGQNKTEANCTSSSVQPQALLVRYLHVNCRSLTDMPLEFYSDNFLSGEHTLELTVNGTSEKPVAFGYVDVMRWSDNNGCVYS